MRNAHQFLKETLLAILGERAAHLAEIHRQQHQRGELARKSLRGSHADFRPRVGQNRSRRLARDHRTVHIANGQRLGALLLGFPLRGQSVRGFAGLADANREGLGIDDRIAIPELAAVVHFDGNFRELLDHEFAGLPGVPARAAGHDLDLRELAELLLGNVHLVEEHLAGIERHAGEQRVANGAGLLEDFLLHEMLVAALFGHDGVPGDVLHGALDGIAIEVHDADALRSEHGDVAVRQEKHVARVREDRGNVGRDEIFVLSQADHGRRAGARGDDFVRVRGGKNRQGIDARELAHGLSHGVLQRAAFFHVPLDEVGDNFGVGLGDELVALFFEFALQIHVILDDSVVDDDDISRAVAMRMGVFFGGTAMRGPARMSDAVRAVDRGLANHFFQIVQLAGSAADLHLSVRPDYGDAGGVIPSIFEAAQPIQNQGDNFLGSDVSDDSTHSFISGRLARRQTRRPA